VEIGLTQTVHRVPEVQHPLLGACRQHAQGASKRKASPLRHPPSANLIDDDLIGSQFFSQQNRIALAGVEVGKV